MLSTPRTSHNQRAQDELACLAFLEKFFNSGHDTSLNLNVCALNEALFSLFLNENKEKLLILYLHNHETEFSMEFCRLLSEDEETKNLLGSHFILHCWDIGEDEYQATLMDTLDSMLQLLPCVDMVRKKQPAVIFIGTEDMDFQICSVIRDIPSLNGINTTMSLLAESVFENILKDSETTPENKESDESCGYTEFQQRMFNGLGNRDYDRFEASELGSLKEKINFALFGLPVEETGYSDKQNEETQKMYDIILESNNEFSEYENQVTLSIVYNCLVPLDSSSNQQYSPVPVFIIRKCSSSEHPCRIVIDHTRRVYKNWESYIEDNKFCQCWMVVPENGCYEEDEFGRVKLQKLKSPSCSVGKKILKATDITTSVLGIGSTGVMVAAAIPAVAVAPVALLGAAAVGAGVGAYSIGRSISTLIDRGKHKQSLNVTEAESRGAYLNIAAGVVGFAGAGANAVVSNLAANGVTVGTSARIAVNTLGVANIGIGGLAVTNSAAEIFMRWWIDDETPSALSVLQLSTSILFFGHAIYSFKTAGTIIEETQTSTMRNFKEGLSNKQRKMFRKLELETIRQNGGNVNQGRAEVISAIARLKDKTEVFSFLSKHNKKFNELGVKFSAKGGQINLNGEALNLNQISSLSGNDVYSYFSDLPKSMLEPPSIDTRRTGFDTFITIENAIVFMRIVIGPRSLQEKIHQVLIKVINDLNIDEAHHWLIQLMQDMFPNGEWHIQMLKMVLSYLQNQVEEIQRRFDEDELENWQKILMEYLRDLNGCQRKLAMLQYVCDTLLLGFRSNSANIYELIRFCMDWAVSAYVKHTEDQERNATVEQGHKREKIVTCKECNGVYFEV
ncbi:uncharacterized protein LOC123674932 isoform X1 [Harmonia axyridis]|uniref:uncharacterized protein LOC123674932 isoform X1 n=2 Tax=Harmonia axyridis TaxID=115357 RepID=UPI001E2783C9|nr:uncharacterized protein LOC123674932 isoform X1 [Harmonia axyridis]XP_045466061.1 uncharacterized protein LOC123674932 isoform X1 [Harmonia axyridis]